MNKRTRIIRDGIFVRKLKLKKKKKKLDGFLFIDWWREGRDFYSQCLLREENHFGWIIRQDAVWEEGDGKGNRLVGTNIGNGWWLPTVICHWHTLQLQAGATVHVVVVVWHMKTLWIVIPSSVFTVHLIYRFILIFV